MSGAPEQLNVANLEAPRRRSLWVDSARRLFTEKPLGALGAVVTVALLITGLFADLLAPYGYNEVFPELAKSPPSARFWLGTDHIGRDMLSRVIYGARISMIVGLAASVVSSIVELVLGMSSGYLGRKFDLILQRFVDAVMGFPGIVLLVVVMSLVGPGMATIIIVLGLRWGINGSRIIRGAVLSIKSNVYVDAAIATGCRTTQILVRHILPHIVAPLIINFSTRVPGIILTEASLSFLGYGVPPPAPSWGGMLSGPGREHMLTAPWIAIWPGVALSVVVYGVNMLGDAVRDILDPRLRGGSGRYGVRAHLAPRRTTATAGEGRARAVAAPTAGD
ncbi:MAG: ABC transporter permease [Spirochaetaceae bacterium]|nr:ABC transporter permease [Spirochaetaceae bacterium]